MLFILIVIYFVFISLGLPDSLFGVVWPVIHKEFAVAENFASIYMIIVAVTSGSVSFVAGRLLRKFGTAKVTLFSILLTVIGLFGTSLSPNLWVMMVFSIIMGFGAGAIDTGLNNYVSLHYKSRHMNWLHCFWGVGVTVSPLIMSGFLANGEWRGGYRIIALLQLMITALVAVALPKWIATERKSDTIDNAKDCDNRVPEADTSDEKKPSFFKMAGIIPCILSLGSYCGMEFLIGTWGASYFVNAHSCSPDDAANRIALFYGGIMAGRFISGIISVKVSDKLLIRGGSLTALAGIVLLAMPAESLSFIGLMLIGLGFGPIFPCVLHAVPSRFGVKYSADITGFHMGGAYATGFALQLTFGFVATSVSFSITPYILLALCITMLALSEITNQVISRRKGLAQ